MITMWNSLAQLLRKFSNFYLKIFCSFVSHMHFLSFLALSASLVSPKKLFVFLYLLSILSLCRSGHHLFSCIKLRLSSGCQLAAYLILSFYLVQNTKCLIAKYKIFNEMQKLGNTKQITKQIENTLPTQRKLYETNQGTGEFNICAIPGPSSTVTQAHRIANPSCASSPCCLWPCVIVASFHEHHIQSNQRKLVWWRFVFGLQIFQSTLLISVRRYRPLFELNDKNLEVINYIR